MKYSKKANAKKQGDVQDGGGGGLGGGGGAEQGAVAQHWD